MVPQGAWPLLSTRRGAGWAASSSRIPSQPHGKTGAGTTLVVGGDGCGSLLTSPPGQLLVGDPGFVLGEVGQFTWVGWPSRAWLGCPAAVG